MQHHHVWSRSRRSLFEKCPRAWLLKYGLSQQFWVSTERKQILKKPEIRLPWELMLRACKQTVIQCLEDLKMDIQWSELYLKRMMKENFQIIIDEQQMQINLHAQSGTLTLPNHWPMSSELQEKLTRIGLKRIENLWQTDIIRTILATPNLQWQVFRRTDRATFCGIDIYTAPDLAVKIQNHWHLVRLDMQGSRDGPSDDLEGTLMMMWALCKPGFPELENKYKIRVNKWTNGYWAERRYVCSNEVVCEGFDLLNKDVSQMKMVLEIFGEAGIEAVPVARQEKDCKTCAFQRNCYNGLETLREVQTNSELAALLAQLQPATRSSNTDATS